MKRFDIYSLKVKLPKVVARQPSIAQLVERWTVVGYTSRNP